MIYYKAPGLTIYNEDGLTINLPEEEKADLMVTSPPYGCGKNYDKFDDDMEYGEYLNFLEDWAKVALTMMKEGGRACINIPISKAKGDFKAPLTADFIKLAMGVGWKYHGIVIWHKPIITAQQRKRGTIMSARKPSICVNYFEPIIILYKDFWEKKNDGLNDITEQENKDWCESVWSFYGRPDRNHPAIFPVELPKRCIKLFSYIGDTVIDPFMGTGTTPLAAVALNRKAIGIDISEKYCKIAKRRILMQTHIGKGELFKQVDILGGGISNKEEREEVRVRRAENTVRTKNIRSFLK